MSTSGMLVAQFSTEPGLEAATIRYLSASSYSHVDLVVPPEECRLRKFYCLDEMLLGSRFVGGVQVRPLNYAKFTRTLRLGCVVPDIGAAYDFAFSQIGKPYAKRKILDFFLHKFGRDQKYDPNQKDWFCDELVYETYAAGGVLLLDDRNPLNLSPQCVRLSPLLTEQ